MVDMYEMLERDLMEELFPDDHEGELVTKDTASEVAKCFRHHALVRDIEMFGSVARDGEGRDLDLILIVDESVFQNFTSDINTALRRPPYGKFGVYGTYGSAAMRLNAAESALPYLHMFLSAAEDILSAECWNSGRQGRLLDIFLFPADWRTRLEELQGAIPHDDPYFMRNIARDAQRI